jgi:hypothetical protein
MYFVTAESAGGGWPTQPSVAHPASTGFAVVGPARDSTSCPFDFRNIGWGLGVERVSQSPEPFVRTEPEPWRRATLCLPKPTKSLAHRLSRSLSPPRFPACCHTLAHAHPSVPTTALPPPREVFVHCNRFPTQSLSPGLPACVHFSCPPTGVLTSALQCGCRGSCKCRAMLEAGEEGGRGRGNFTEQPGVIRSAGCASSASPAASAPAQPARPAPSLKRSRPHLSPESVESHPAASNTHQPLLVLARPPRSRLACWPVHTRSSLAAPLHLQYKLQKGTTQQDQYQRRARGRVLMSRPVGRARAIRLARQPP